MKTWTSREAAEQDRQDGAQHIAEIEHVTLGRVYIQIKCSLDILRKALANKPMPEIKQLIAEYDYPKTDREIRAELVDNLNSLIAQDHDDHEARIERAMQTGIAPNVKDYTAQIATAKQKLADFDAAHPAILAAIEKEHQENIDRHFWD